MTRGPVMVMAGGTGGHVFPALAVAERLRERGWSVFWLGTRSGLEARLVPAAGIEIEWVDVRGLRGKGVLAWLLAPFRVLSALRQSSAIIRRRRPTLVLGLGGYVSGPGGVAAWLGHIPLLIHEQNSIAGLTNRLLARFARRVLTGFPAVLPRAEWIGNPVRDDIEAIAGPEERLAGRVGRLNLLVLGGSQGARTVNRVVIDAVARMPETERPVVRHQCGERWLEETALAWREAGVEAVVVPFIDDMAEAYAWADLVVCRAGALTVAEVAAAGVAALFIPFPHAVDDHQTSNARFLAEAGAAEILPEATLDAAGLSARVAELAADRAALMRMASAARASARPSATEALVAACEQASRGAD